MSRFRLIQTMLIDYVTQAGKTCPQEDINLVAKLFEHNTKGIPECRNIRYDGQTSHGFYALFVSVTMVETDSKQFLQILKVDQKIGWTNPTHVEKLVFYNKAIKVINDEKVTNRSKQISN